MNLKCSLYLFLIMLFHQPASAVVHELGLAIDTNFSYKLKETGTPNYNHESGMKFLGGLGLGVSYRGFFEFSKISLGAIIQYGWKEEAADRFAENSETKVGYTFQSKRLFAGLHFGYSLLEFLRLNLEYVPYLNTNIHWSDDKSENPFSKGDSMSGNSVGAGLSLILGKKITWTALYRVISYDKIKTKGITRTLPDSLYSKIDSHEVSASMALQF